MSRSLGPSKKPWVKNQHKGLGQKRLNWYQTSILYYFSGKQNLEKRKFWEIFLAKGEYSYTGTKRKE